MRVKKLMSQYFKTEQRLARGTHCGCVWVTTRELAGLDGSGPSCSQGYMGELGVMPMTFSQVVGKPELGLPPPRKERNKEGVPARVVPHSTSLGTTETIMFSLDSRLFTQAALVPSPPLAFLRQPPQDACSWRELSCLCPVVRGEASQQVRASPVESGRARPEGSGHGLLGGWRRPDHGGSVW